jgi:uncharacterized protein (TIGR03083 family)
MSELATRAELLEALAAERAALEGLAARFSDEAWRAATRADGWTAHDIAAHLADATYALALMALGELQPSMPLNERGWMEVDDFNQQRRRKNAELPREKVVSRLSSSFDHARRAIEAADDLSAPGPYGPVHTRGLWLNRIVAHAREHRGDIEGLLG